jgi:ribonuclease P protein component
MLNKTNRIKSRPVIEKLFKKGDRYQNQFLIFKYEKTDHEASQFVTSVSKKLIKKATKRNRLRRQIQEGLRINLPDLKENIKALVIAKASCQKATFKELSESIHTFFKSFSPHAE